MHERRIQSRIKEMIFIQIFVIVSIQLYVLYSHWIVFLSPSLYHFLSIKTKKKLSQKLLQNDFTNITTHKINKTTTC